MNSTKTFLSLLFFIFSQATCMQTNSSLPVTNFLQKEIITHITFFFDYTTMASFKQTCATFNQDYSFNTPPTTIFNNQYYLTQCLMYCAYTNQRDKIKALFSNADEERLESMQDMGYTSEKCTVDNIIAAYTGKIIAPTFFYTILINPITKMIICQSTRPNQVDYNRSTPFVWACRKNDKEAVELLLANNYVDKNKADQFGHTPILEACHNSHSTIVKLLLADKNIDVNKADMHGRTPFTWCCAYQAKEFVQLLLTNKTININHVQKNGSTGLSIACYQEKGDIVELLLSYKNINTTQADKQGLTALKYAQYKNNPKIIKLLTNHQAQ